MTDARASSTAARVQKVRSGAARSICRPTGTWRHIGGSRVIATASNHHAARLLFRNASVLIANSVLGDSRENIVCSAQIIHSGAPAPA